MIDNIDAKSNRELYKNQAELERVKDLPQGTLKRAKKLGCGGMPHNGRNLDWFIIEQWLEENASLMVKGNGSTSLQQAKLEGQLLSNEKTELELKKLKDKLVERSDVYKLIRFLGTAQKAILVQRLHHELPSMVVGKSENEIAEITGAIVQEVCAALETLKI